MPDAGLKTGGGRFPLRERSCTHDPDPQLSSARRNSVFCLLEVSDSGPLCERTELLRCAGRAANGALGWTFLCRRATAARRRGVSNAERHGRVAGGGSAISQGTAGARAGLDLPAAKRRPWVMALP